MRLDMRPEHLVRDGQSGERDVVQVLTLLGRDDEEGERDRHEEGTEQRPLRPEFLQPVADQPDEVPGLTAGPRQSGQGPGECTGACANGLATAAFLADLTFRM